MKHGKIFAIIGAIILVAVAGAMAVVFVNRSGDDAEVGRMEKFLYSRGFGTSGGFKYVVTREGEKAQLEYSFYGETRSEDESFTELVDGKVFDDLEQIVQKHHLAEWDGFDESEDGVLDGSGFGLEIRYDSGKTITADGYMVYPDNHEEVFESLDDYFEKLVDEIKRSK